VFRLVRIHSVFGYNSIVRNTFIGYVVATMLYAILKTHFITLHVVFMFLLGCAAYELTRNREKIQKLVNEEVGLKNRFILIVLPLIVFSWAWFSIYDGESAIQFNFFSDTILYSKISRSIAVTGFENGFNFLNDFDSFYHGPEPYHYFDVWGGALIASLLQLNHYLTLQLVIYPVFYLLFLYSLFTLLSGEKRVYINAIICILLLFLCGMYAPYYQKIPFIAVIRLYSFNILTPWMTKLSFFYIFFILTYRLYSKDLRELSLLCLLGLTVASILTLPVIVVSVLLIIGYEFYATPETRREGVRKALYVLATAFLIILFYMIFKRQSAGLAGVEITSPVKLLLNNIINIQWRMQRNFMGGGLIRLILSYLPFLPLLYLVFRLPRPDKVRVTRYFGKLIPVILLVSLGGWMCLFRELNSFEIFTVISVPLLNTALIIVIVSVIDKFEYYRKENGKLLILSAIPIVFVIGTQILNTLPGKNIESYSLQSNDYLEKIREVIKTRQLKSGVSIKDAGVLMEPHEKYNAVYPLGEYIMLMDESVAIVNIGDYNTPIDSSSSMTYERSMKAISGGLFYRYVKNKANGKITRAMVESMQLSFVNEYKIQFLILTKFSSVPEKLASRVDEIFSDSSTGEKFVILK
jgi:hypothetical protein